MDDNTKAEAAKNPDSAAQALNAPIVPDPRIAELEAALADMTGKHDDLEETNAALKADLDQALSAKVDAEARAAKMIQRPKSPKARKFGAHGAAGDPMLLKALLDGDGLNPEAFEIVASDGKKELTQFPPVAVSGDIWRSAIAGMVLLQSLTLKGGSPEDATAQVAGFALVDGAGKQVGWAALSMPLTIPPQQEMRFDGLAFS